jgi:arylsulfatase A-like enzyme
MIRCRPVANVMALALCALCTDWRSSQGHKNGYLNPELITPHTHEVVAEGVRFLNHYVFKFCSPTRSSFLSGRLPIHVNMENSATEQPRAGVEANFTMVSEVLSAHGYKCAHVGKW